MSNQHPHKSTTTFEKYIHVKVGSTIRTATGRTVQAATYFVRPSTDGRFYAAVAECDSRDQFCKKTGRNVARRKWFRGKRYEVSSPSYDDVVNFTTSVTHS